MTPNNDEPEKGELFIPNRAGRRYLKAVIRKSQNVRGPNFTKPKKKRK